jgi:hypothetical protein
MNIRPRGRRTYQLDILTVATLLSIASFAQTRPSPPPEKVAVVYGQSIRYIEAGQGPG